MNRKKVYFRKKCLEFCLYKTRKLSFLTYAKSNKFRKRNLKQKARKLFADLHLNKEQGGGYILRPIEYDFEYESLMMTDLA